MSKITAEISPKLVHNMKNLVADGWFKNMNELIEESIRRFVESHSAEIMEQFIKEDIKWGLHGED
ncbi:MAG: CopG family transcriptional regulator [Proteobacteria bacterium]|nr:CopG family transcriptional regulator [Pseudomonadota bacterium]